MALPLDTTLGTTPLAPFKLIEKFSSLHLMNLQGVVKQRSLEKEGIIPNPSPYLEKHWSGLPLPSKLSAQPCNKFFKKIHGANDSLWLEKHSDKKGYFVELTTTSTLVERNFMGDVLDSVNTQERCRKEAKKPPVSSNAKIGAIFTNTIQDNILSTVKL